MHSTSSRAKSKTIPHRNRASTSKPDLNSSMLSSNGSLTKGNSSLSTLSSNGKIRTAGNSTFSNSNGKTRTIGKSMPSNSGGKTRTAVKSMPSNSSGKIRTSGNSTLNNSSGRTRTGRRSAPSRRGAINNDSAHPNSSVFNRAPGGSMAHNTGSPITVLGNNVAATTAIASRTTASAYISDRIMDSVFTAGLSWL